MNAVGREGHRRVHRGGTREKTGSDRDSTERFPVRRGHTPVVSLYLDCGQILEAKPNGAGPTATASSTKRRAIP